MIKTYLNIKKAKRKKAYDIFRRHTSELRTCLRYLYFKHLSREKSKHIVRINGALA